jgi:CO dehydrogenase maturation factor
MRGCGSTTFLIDGDFVSLIDEKAGIEHFGRRIPDHMDVILGVLDCTHESISIARRMSKFSEEMGMKDFWLVLNKTESGEMASMMLALLGDLSNKVIGSIPQDPGLVMAGLSGSPVGELKAIENVEPIVQRLEQSVSLQQKTT